MDINLNGFLPILPIRNAVLFPGAIVPFAVGRAKSVAAVEQALASGGWIIAAMQRPESDSREPGASDVHLVGTLAKIEREKRGDSGGFQIVARGVSRFRIDETREHEGRIEGKGAVWNDVPDDQDTDGKTSRALLDGLKSLSLEILELLPADTSQLQELVGNVTDLPYLANLVAANLDIPSTKRQEILEAVHVKERALALLDLMTKQKETLEVQGEIREKLSHKMGKLQREAFLREQMKTIREELGEGEDPVAREDYRKKIEAADMPPEAKKIALEELHRLEAIGNASPESHVIRNYLDLLCAMPWNRPALKADPKTETVDGTDSKNDPTESIDLDRARKILDEDHYGLEKVKKRILQHLAVMKLKKGGRGSILLLVGPPGVGKTSLGQSIARALDRKFVRGALGGVRDDSEIRGHRRTYIGAMPGRIIQGLKRADANNPVFVLDEIDKLSRGFQGDPGGALLEVLDPEQNSAFTDHYLDVPFDLSKVFFIATANSLETIPGPLLDRMEVIELTGYTTAEKLHIAKRHLLSKQLAEHGLEGRVEVTDAALLKLITAHTREGGVRELQRAIAGLCRAAAERLLLGASALPAVEAEVQAVKGSSDTLPLPKVVIDVGDLDEIVGPERFIHELAERVAPPGVVTGLAWTPHGGEILFIEAGLMPGTGRLLLTGQLGEVMKESAQIALSLVRSKLGDILPSLEFDKKDMHIHVPAGAIPKDGPSAGVAMLATVASLFSGRSVDPRLAMTGEITLRGAVMPVGGIKEKVIAAHRAGIERLVLPKRNERDLRDVPQEVREGLRIDFVESAADVLRITLGLEPRDLSRILPPPPAVA